MSNPCLFEIGDTVRLDPAQVNPHYSRDVGRDLEVVDIGYYDREHLIYYINFRGEKIGAYQWRFFHNKEESLLSPLDRKIRKLWDRQNYVKKGLHHATV